MIALVKQNEVSSKEPPVGPGEAASPKGLSVILTVERDLFHGCCFANLYATMSTTDIGPAGDLIVEVSKARVRFPPRFSLWHPQYLQRCWNLDVSPNSSDTLIGVYLFLRCEPWTPPTHLVELIAKIIGLFDFPVRLDCGQTRD